MKIVCDVCDKDEASVFCVADEAALCAACDHRVHHANKLAGKHRRFSLLQPSPKNSPVCDICQERRAFLFCRQDRAILCRECDVSIHRANEHTQKHARFLLTGLKLSATSSMYSPSDSAPVSSAENKRSSSDSTNFVTTSAAAPPQSCETTNDHSMNLVDTTSLAASSSSISEYFTETLSGWHVEEFLDSSACSLPYNPYGFCKSGGEDDNDDVALSLWDADFGNHLGAGKLGLWVPQVPPPLNQSQGTEMMMAFGAPNGSKEFSGNDLKSGRKWCEDTSFVVPQMSQSCNSSKRLRTLWQ